MKNERFSLSAMPMYSHDQATYIRQMYEWHMKMVECHLKMMEREVRVREHPKNGAA